MNNLELIAQQCKNLLQHPNASAHVEYINNRLNNSMQDKFGFGYFPSNNDIELLLDVVGEDVLQSLGLVYSKNIHDSIYPRKIRFSYFEHQSLVMPYKNVYGEVVALVGRSILDENTRTTLKIDKYKNTQFTKGDHVFGLYEAKESILNSGFVYIVEGQFDVIKAHERGLTNIVALGTASMTAYQLSLICRYTDNIFLLLDNDMAGEKGRREIIKKYEKHANMHNVYLPNGYKDMDEYLVDHDMSSMSLLTDKVITSGI